MAAARGLMAPGRLLAGSLWQTYTRSLESNPVLTKGLTSMSGFVLGDLLAQVPACHCAQ